MGDTQHDEKREERYALMLRRNEADGLIFLGHRLPEAAAELIQANRRHPAPIVNRWRRVYFTGVPSVHIDNEKAAYQAMDHLFALGHRRIGVVTGPLGNLKSAIAWRVFPLERKRKGPATILWSCTVTFRLNLARWRPSDSSAARIGPTAIFCFNDEMAMGALKIARRLRVSVPEQLSLVGFIFDLLSI